MSSSSSSSSSRTKRLVLIGGGHAHVQVIKSLNKQSRPKKLHVTLIDRQSSASYSGMVPGCVSKLYTPEETLIHLPPLAKWSGIDFINDEVIDIDISSAATTTNNDDDSSGSSSNRIILKSGKEVLFDAVSLDIGSTSRGVDDIPGVKEYTIPTRPINELVTRIQQSETTRTFCTSQGLQIVVVGGGAAGIELSLALRARWAHKTNCNILLLDGGSTLLPSETPACRSALRHILSSYHISVQHDAIVTRVSPNNIHLASGRVISFSHCIWAGGAAPHGRLTRRLGERGLALDNRGWIRVSATLQSVSHETIFAAGDCATIEDGERSSPPKAGVYAVRAGPILIRNLSDFLCCDDLLELTRYVPQDDFLKLIMCGDRTALGFRFGIPFYGKWVWDLKDHIDDMFMDLFREENLLRLDDEDGDDDKKRKMDTKQYDDVSDTGQKRLEITDAADLLLRRDDGVDYQRAWNVLRVMMKDNEYKERVLELVNEKGGWWLEKV